MFVLGAMPDPLAASGVDPVHTQMLSKCCLVCLCSASNFAFSCRECVIERVAGLVDIWWRL